MERSLLFGAFGIGWLSVLCAVLVAAGRREKPAGTATGIPRFHLFSSFGLLLLGFLATLPSRPPFAAGQGLGWGFLLGGIGALIAGGIAAQALRGVENVSPAAPDTTRAAAAIAAPYAIAVIFTAIPLLWMRQTLMDTLFGIAIGWLTITFVLSLPFLTSHAPPGRRLLLPLASGLGFIVTLVAIAALGESRLPVTFLAPTNKVSWSALGLLLASGVPFTLLLCALPTPIFARIAPSIPLVPLLMRLFHAPLDSAESRTAAARGARMACSVALLLVLGKVVAGRILDKTPLFTVLAIGMTVGLLAWWIVAERTRREQEGWQYAGLAALVVAAGFMAAYQLLAGVGVGALWIAAWLVAGGVLTGVLEAADPTAEEQSERMAFGLTQLLLFGVLLLLYRVFVTFYVSDIRGVALTDQYALFGLLFGAALPTLLSGFLLQSAQATHSPGRPLLRLTGLGALALAAPAFLLLLWGAKCALLFLFGLAIAALVSELSPVHASRERGAESRGLLAAFFALAIALALVQGTSHLLPLAELTRAEKVRILTWAVGGLIALILVLDYGGRINDWRNRRSARSAESAVPQGGAR